MKLDRTWRVVLLVTVLVVAAAILSQTVFRRVPEDCRPVQELLDFNTAQSAIIAEKSEGEEANTLPSAAEQAAYAAWADGLADRASRVTSPQLAQHAVQLATLADDFVSKLSQLGAQTQSRAPGAPVPPVAYAMSILNDQITEEIDALSKACGR